MYSQKWSKKWNWSSLTTVLSVENPENGKKTTVRSVISIRCPIHIISRKAAARLGIECVFDETSLVLEHNYRKYSKATKWVAKVIVNVPHATPFPLQLHVVEEVCDKAVYAPTVEEFKQEHRHAANMHFPDPGRDLPVEMLVGGGREFVGLEYKGELNGEKCPSLNSDWKLASSRFGWLIVGIDRTGETKDFHFKIQDNTRRYE